ncbi:hypothetical protein [Neobacillus sp. CF12]|nr:hypothetical protein [Neobacillus sp. CF12]MDM5327763.1 hypothetical protein [Neobacillus sp. CF12]
MKRWRLFYGRTKQKQRKEDGIIIPQAFDDLPDFKAECSNQTKY